MAPTAQLSDDASIERVNIGDTAIVHCTFDDVDQIGAFTQAKVRANFSLSSLEGCNHGTAIVSIILFYFV